MDVMGNSIGRAALPLTVTDEPVYVHAEDSAEDSLGALRTANVVEVKPAAPLTSPARDNPRPGPLPGRIIRGPTPAP